VSCVHGTSMHTVFPERISVGYWLLVNYIGLAEDFTYFQVVTSQNTAPWLRPANVCRKAWFVSFPPFGFTN